MSIASPERGPLAVAEWGDGEDTSKSDRYLADRLAAAGADYKGVAVTTFLMAAGLAAVGWLVVGVAADHWLVRGGLPTWARWTWLALGIVALVAAACRWIVPLIRYRVNLVYAARAIERDYPELHNDLVNTVLVKARPDASARPVVRSLERRAAKRLSRVPSDGVIDRSLAFRLTVALAIAVLLCVLYGLFAPKSTLRTTARLLAPWVGIAPPTRVTIAPPQLSWRMPGEALEQAADPRRALQVAGNAVPVTRGRQVVVAAGISGLRAGEQPTIEIVSRGGGRWLGTMTADPDSGDRRSSEARYCVPRAGGAAGAAGRAPPDRILGGNY